MPGFMMKCKEFFGLRPGQTAMEFGKELQQLTYEDKQEIHAQLNAQGHVCDPPTPPVAK
jgi:hypothetical protein